MASTPKDCPGVTTEDAGKRDACEGCPSQKDCSSGTFRKQAEYISKCLETVKKIILVLSGKGGVGKSTVATQIAWGLSLAGKEVGILDVDICGPSIPRMLGKENAEVKRTSTGWVPVTVRENLSVISVAYLVEDQDAPLIWRGPRITSLVNTFFSDVNWGNLDYLIVDTPPGTSDIQIALGQLLSLTDCSAVLVTTPQEVALRDVRKGIRFCQQAHMDVLGMVENMSGFICPCCDTVTEIFKASSGGATKLCEDLKIDLLAKIPLDPTLGNCTDGGKAAQFGFGKSGTADALTNLIKSITGDENITFTEGFEEDMEEEENVQIIGDN